MAGGWKVLKSRKTGLDGRSRMEQVMCLMTPVTESVMVTSLFPVNFHSYCVILEICKSVTGVFTVLAPQRAKCTIGLARSHLSSG